MQVTMIFQIKMTFPGNNWTTQVHLCSFDRLCILKIVYKGKDFYNVKNIDLHALTIVFGELQNETSDRRETDTDTQAKKHLQSSYQSDSK